MVIFDCDDGQRLLKSGFQDSLQKIGDTQISMQFRDPHPLLWGLLGTTGTQQIYIYIKQEKFVISCFLMQIAEYNGIGVDFQHCLAEISERIPTHQPGHKLFLEQANNSIFLSVEYIPFVGSQFSNSQVQHLNTLYT